VTADRGLFNGPALPDAEFVAAELVVRGKLTLEEIAEKAGIPLDRVKAVMSTPQVRGYLSKHLDDAGATLEASAKVIAEAHQAEKIVVVSYKGDSHLVNAGVDFGTRLAAAELNLKARGELKDGGQSINLFMDLSDEDLARIAAGQLDPATLIDVGPRISNPAAAPEEK
jgi:folylpolyglutamate synthase/dihydropteroate synthase